MKALIIGMGKMGQLIASTLKEKGHEVLGMGDLMHPSEIMGNLKEADIIFDFSHPDNIDWILPLAVENEIPIVEGTTALNDEQKKSIEEASKAIPVFFTANYSLGIAVLKKLTSIASDILRDDWDIEILEKHHNQKADAPSGTALMLLDAADPDQEFDHVLGRGPANGKRQKEIGVSAMRGGTLAGYHEVDFEGPDESLALSHNANNRQIFVNGAINAAEYLKNQPAGLYDLDQMVEARLNSAR